MTSSYFIAALGTPLDAEENLHRDGLRAHLADQQANEIDGVLVGGTMGMMQLLRDSTYHDLVQLSSELYAGKGELFVGVGDASFARTLDRLRLANQFPIDVAVVLSPYFMKFTQEQLIDYYRAIADESRVPLYLYDLPQTTGTVLTLDTVTTLAKHPNIRGIKCSGDIAQARVLIDSVAGENFRVIVAQPLIVDVLLRHGVHQHLDGVYALFPEWVKKMKHAVGAERWDEAAALSKGMGRVMPRLHHYGVLSAMTTLLNARGIPGSFAPRPYPVLAPELAQALLNESTIREL
jgi:4-hydroxy-tetrahydrodipicolinate synthase